MKQLLLAILTFVAVAACCQAPAKYSVVIGNDYIQVDPNGNLDTVSSLNIIPSKEYEAILTLEASLTPSIRILKNDIGDISWSHTATGTWTATLSGAFRSNQTVLTVQQQGRGSSPRIYAGEYTDANTVTVYAMNSSLSLADPSVSQQVHVLIKVYY